MKIQLIGKEIKIIQSTNKELEGIQGKVVDETKNTVSVEKNGKTVKIVKDLCVFDVEGKLIKGSEISKVPEERIKK